jgi:hypothetical protein
MLKAGLTLLCGLLMATSVAAEVLIKESEAKLPPAPATAPATRAITRGPGIRVVSPEGAVVSPFPLRVVFEPRGGAKIDLSSVTMTYLRTPNVNLLDRVRGGLSEKGIDLVTAEAPPGEHQVRLTVQDSEGRQTSTLLNLNVVK